MSKNKQFIFLFFNYIYLIYNLLKHYFKISMKFPLNLPLEGDLRIWKSFLRIAITAVLVCPMSLKIAEFGKLTKVAFGSGRIEAERINNGFRGDLAFASRKIQNIDQFLRQRRLYRPFPRQSQYHNQNQQGLRNWQRANQDTFFFGINAGSPA